MAVIVKPAPSKGEEVDPFQQFEAKVQSQEATSGPESSELAMRLDALFRPEANREGCEGLRFHDFNNNRECMRIPTKSFDYVDISLDVQNGRYQICSAHGSRNLEESAVVDLHGRIVDGKDKIELWDIGAHKLNRQVTLEVLLPELETGLNDRLASRERDVAIARMGTFKPKI